MHAAFTVVIGQEVEQALAARMEREVADRGESLVQWQVKTRGEGYQAAEIVKSLYGWSLRHASGLDEFALIASARRGDVDGSYDDAVRAGREWVEQAPEFRYVFVRASALVADPVHYQTGA